jgi:putative transposase
MTLPPISYNRHRFPPEIIAQAGWLYFRAHLSLRFVEEMLLDRVHIAPALSISRRILRGWCAWLHQASLRARHQPPAPIASDVLVHRQALRDRSLAAPCRFVIRQAGRSSPRSSTVNTMRSRRFHQTLAKMLFAACCTGLVIRQSTDKWQSSSSG